MATRFTVIDRDTPLLLPIDMRDWVKGDHMVRFVIDAVDLLELGTAHVNHRGTGSTQYPPSMMLALLIYCYATGTFSSRKIERLTHENVAVRLLCANTHPDHDTICTFRRQNELLLQSSFHQVLELAASAKILKVGQITLAADGTKILANASKHCAVSFGHAEQQMVLLEDEIKTLLAKAEDADATPLEDGLTISKEIKRREDRLASLSNATVVIKERAKERYKKDLAEHEAKMAERQAKKDAGQKKRGREPEPPKEGPLPGDQFNFTDPESRIMKAGGGFAQCYNAQAAVEVESRLIVSAYVTDAANDKEQLVPIVKAVSPVIESVGNVLVDNGFSSQVAIQTIEQDVTGEPTGSTVYAPTGRLDHRRRLSDLEKQTDPPPASPGASFKEQMAARMGTKAAKALYGVRKETIEPVFGIIKEAMGFRRFSLRGKAKVGIEFTLVVLSYNIKRLFHLGATLTS
jgi:transposase